jgi:hypothetical protein
MKPKKNHFQIIPSTKLATWQKQTSRRRRPHAFMVKNKRKGCYMSMAKNGDMQCLLTSFEKLGKEEASAP